MDNQLNLSCFSPVNAHLINKKRNIKVITKSRFHSKKTIFIIILKGHLFTKMSELRG